jgi:cytohesin
MHAARSGRVEAVKLLLLAGAQVNARESWNGQSPLHWAAAEGHGAVVEALIEGGADIRQRSNAGSTPFLFAVRKGDMRSVKAFLDAGADVNEKRPADLATPLLVAIINGYEDLVDLLLDKGADPNAEGGSTDLSVQGSKARPIKITLKTPSYREQLRDVGTEGGNGTNNSWGRPLQAAIHVANWHISDEFVNVNVDRLRIVKSLIKHGADVNSRNTDMEPRWSGARYRRRQVGLTPFLAAARQADLEVMRLLVENGADPKMNTPLNITPLMLVAGIAWASNQDRASEQQVLDAVKYLVEELGSDVNFVADTGETAMHAAAYRGANSVVQYLFDKGAKLDVVDKSGRTPLQVADGVEYGNSFAANPHTAVLLRKLGAKEIPCPGLCPNLIPEEALPPEEPVR